LIGTVRSVEGTPTIVQRRRRRLAARFMKTMVADPSRAPQWPMPDTSITTDYLVVGAGASGLAFTDALIAEDPDAQVTIVDRLGQPGGHWNHAYPVRHAAPALGVLRRQLARARQRPRRQRRPERRPRRAGERGRGQPRTSTA
jgi:hypothetical protein